MSLHFPEYHLKYNPKRHQLRQWENELYELAGKAPLEVKEAGHIICERYDRRAAELVEKMTEKLLDQQSPSIV